MGMRAIQLGCCYPLGRFCRYGLNGEGRSKRDVVVNIEIKLGTILGGRIQFAHDLIE